MDLSHWRGHPLSSCSGRRRPLFRLRRRQGICGHRGDRCSQMAVHHRGFRLFRARGGWRHRLRRVKRWERICPQGIHGCARVVARDSREHSLVFPRGSGRHGLHRLDRFHSLCAQRIDWRASLGTHHRRSHLLLARCLRRSRLRRIL